MPFPLSPRQSPMPDAYPSAADHAVEISLLIFIAAIAFLTLPFFLLALLARASFLLLRRHPASRFCAIFFWLCWAFRAPLNAARLRSNILASFYAPTPPTSPTSPTASPFFWNTAFWRQARLGILSERLALSISLLDADSATRLIFLGAPLSSFSTASNSCPPSPLERAASVPVQTNLDRLSRLLLVRVLMAAGALPANDRSLHRALAQDDQCLALALLAAGSDPNAVDSAGVSPLCAAALHCSEAIPPLLAAGADPHAHSPILADGAPAALGDSVLHALARNKIWTLDQHCRYEPMLSHIFCARIQAGLDATAALLSAIGGGSRLLPRANTHGATALNVACSLGAAGFVQALLDAGADPRVPDSAGRTPHSNMTLSSQRICESAPPGNPPLQREGVLRALADRLLIEAEHLSISQACHTLDNAHSTSRIAIRI